jgi:NO-binding membrane sensor protein with MHYT domain
METHLTPSLSWLAPLFSAAVSTLFFALLGNGLRKVRGTDPISAYSWWAVAAVTGGSGLWTAQFVALAGLGLPLDMHYSPAIVGLAWGASIVGVAGLLGLARLPWRGAVRSGLQALLLAGLWLGLFLLARGSLGVQPLGEALGGVQWVSGALILMATVLGLGLMFDPRAIKLGRFVGRQWLAASVFGLVAGMAQDLALGGLGFGTGGPVRGDASADTATLWLAVAAGTVVILLGLLGALVDARAHGRNALLASSLSEANRRLREQALADPLTRLPNRLMFEERLEDSLATAEDHPGELAVMFIDLDGFKPINDSFGHVAGDSVLGEVGQRLASITRPSDLAARVGGDEFQIGRAHV